MLDVLGLIACAVAVAVAVVYWFVEFVSGHNIASPVNLPFLILLFGCAMASMCVRLIQDRIEEYSGRALWLLIWLLDKRNQLIFSLANIPIYWSNMVVMIYGFFILPWYTVLICAAIDSVIPGVFHTIFLRRLPLIVALLISYVIMGAAIIWYFGFHDGIGVP